MALLEMITQALPRTATSPVVPTPYVFRASEMIYRRKFGSAPQVMGIYPFSSALLNTTDKAADEVHGAFGTGQHWFARGVVIVSSIPFVNRTS